MAFQDTQITAPCTAASCEFLLHDVDSAWTRMHVQVHAQARRRRHSVHDCVSVVNSKLLRLTVPAVWLQAAAAALFGKGPAGATMGSVAAGEEALLSSCVPHSGTIA